MCFAILNYVVAIATFQANNAPGDLTVTLEFLEWRRKDPAPMEKPGCVPEDAKAEVAIEVDITLGQPFSTTTTIGTKKYHFSGTVEKKDRGNYLTNVHASMVEPNPIPVGNIVIHNVMATSSSATLAVGEKRVVSGATSRFEGAAFRVGLARKAK